MIVSSHLERTISKNSGNLEKKHLENIILVFDHIEKMLGIIDGIQGLVNEFYIKYLFPTRINFEKNRILKVYTEDTS